jgi:phenylpropionate dioxygenase-like ring-hydroxylating dioxygenase large terminal subunit
MERGLALQLRRVEKTMQPSRASSAARVTKAWYVACRSDELAEKPISRRILGQPIAIFRGEGGTPGALLDRCPHRNVPLSLGRSRRGLLECSYHGWAFDTGGVCRSIPALCGPVEAESRNASAFPCREQDGFVWVWCDRESEPDVDPFRFALASKDGYTTVREHVVARSTLHATAENALDVPHTAFLHAGLFRDSDRPRNRIEVVVRRFADRVEAEYIGEPRPQGLVGKVLSPQGGVVEHFDRFILPSIVEVEYRLGESHLLVSAAMTPEEEFLTHLYAVISFKLPIPGFVITPFLRPVAMRIFKQDAVVLERQADNIRAFGGESFVSTEVDVLGPHILRLLRAAERGKIEGSSEPAIKHLEMDV